MVPDPQQFRGGNWTWRGPRADRASDEIGQGASEHTGQMAWDRHPFLTESLNSAREVA